MRTLTTIFSASAALMIAGTAVAQSNHTPVKPAIVLVQGQINDPLTWSGLVPDLAEGGDVATTASFDLRDTIVRKDDVAVVAQLISAQLAPNGSLTDYRLQTATRAGASPVQLAAVAR